MSPPPIPLDRERNRVLVAEALQRAALAANNGSLDSACTMLSEVESMIVQSPSTVAHDPLSEKLLEVVTAALLRLNEALSDLKSRAGPTLFDKSTPLLRSEVAPPPPRTTMPTAQGPAAAVPRETREAVAFLLLLE